MALADYNADARQATAIEQELAFHHFSFSCAHRGARRAHRMEQRWESRKISFLRFDEINRKP